ncbi:MAG: hypothetical protein NC935_07820 [Candidatus Omnitrophica bacterium]|nr:hypothetical protein [Candidatus Omnitrophota bacterium]
MNKNYDLIIVGGGPIGSAIAYFVSQGKEKLNFKNIALIQKEPNVDEVIAYLNAGGSVRWYFEDKEIAEATRKTAEFIIKIKNEVDVNLVKDSYYFVHKGIIAPSLNISGKKLVDYFKKVAKENGVEIFEGFSFENYEKSQDGYIVKTDKGEFLTKRIFFALGYKNKNLFNLDLEVEKRQLFVLDLPVNEERKSLPHTILKFQDGIVYFFIKKFDDGYRLVLGQEDIFEHSLEPEPENYFEKLLELGLDKQLPFLKNAKVEKILWGFDVKNKKPHIQEIEENVWTINCGSAVRSIIHIGEKIIETIKD